MLTESPFLDTPIAYILLILFGGRRIVDIKDDKEERTREVAGIGCITIVRMRVAAVVSVSTASSSSARQQHHQPVQQAHHQWVSGAPCWPLTRLCK